MKLAVITTASQEIGLGHATRQLVLAGAASARGVDVSVLSDSPIVQRMCRDQGVDHLRLGAIDSVGEISAVFAQVSASHVVIDVHERDFPALRPLANTPRHITLVVSRVGHDFQYFGDEVVLLGSDLEHWERTEGGMTPAQPTLRSGRAYMMFRPEFRDVAGQKEDQAVLIAHGGSDQHDLTQQCLRALELSKEKYTCYILVGPAFRDPDSIKAAAEESKHSCAVLRDAKEPSHWMRRASVGLISGGNIRYELCLTRTPFVAVSFNRRQYECTEQLVRMGCGVNVGVMGQVNDLTIAQAVDHLASNAPVRTRMQASMGDLFDLQGADRILDAVLDARKEPAR